MYIFLPDIVSECSSRVLLFIVHARCFAIVTIPDFYFGFGHTLSQYRHQHGHLLQNLINLHQRIQCQLNLPSWTNISGQPFSKSGLYQTCRVVCCIVSSYYDVITSVRAALSMCLFFKGAVPTNWNFSPVWLKWLQFIVYYQCIFIGKAKTLISVWHHGLATCLSNPTQYSVQVR